MKRFLGVMVAFLCIGLVSAGIHTAGAQSGSKMAGQKPAAAKTYYVCAKCKVYYTEAAAKTAKYKDAMGHKLTKSTTIPKGYKDGSKEKMGKMDASKSKM
jgi:hypothetical protein